MIVKHDIHPRLVGVGGFKGDDAGKVDMLVITYSHHRGGFTLHDATQMSNLVSSRLFGVASSRGKPLDTCPSKPLRCVLNDGLTDFCFVRFSTRCGWMG